MNSNVEVIQLIGILDGIQGSQLRRTISDLIRAGTRVILLDCTAVEFMDSAGLGALVTVLRQTQAHGGCLALCGINDQIRMLFELTNTNRLFEVFASPEAFYDFL